MLGLYCPSAPYAVRSPPPHQTYQQGTAMTGSAAAIDRNINDINNKNQKKAESRPTPNRLFPHVLLTGLDHCIWNFAGI